MTQLALGCARLGGGGLGRRDSIRLVGAAFDAGVTVFDTADAYASGDSERALGVALRGRWSDVTIATKGGYRFAERPRWQRQLRGLTTSAIRSIRARRAGTSRHGASTGYEQQDFSADALTRALDASLRRLGAERIDIYQLHGPRDADHDVVTAWAATAISAGKIARLGVGAEDLDQARAWLPCSAVSAMQLPFGLVDPEAGFELIESLEASGRLIMARGVFGAGLLSDPSAADGSNDHKRALIRAVGAYATSAGLTLPELAIGYVRSRPEVDVIVVGARSATHVGELAKVVAAPPLSTQVIGDLGELLRRHAWWAQ